MPDFKIEIRARLAELGLSPVREVEIVEELSQHLEEEYERALSCGASEDEARQQILEQLNKPDLLGRELKHVERRVSHEPIASCAGCLNDSGRNNTAGLLLALAGIRILKTFIPSTVSQVEAINIDASVLIFTAMVAVLTGIAFGLAPAIHASHLNLNDTLKEGGRDSSGGSKGNRARGLLVIAEVAVSFVLLVGAGLLINSFLHLRNLDPGFRADHLLTMKVGLSEAKYPDRDRRTAFFDEVIRRARALPGAQSAAVAGNLPLTYNGDSTSISVEGIP